MRRLRRLERQGRRGARPRSACTPCSTAARKPRASSAWTRAASSTPTRATGWSATPSRDAKVMAACAAAPPIGHNRYATTGETALRNVQPLYADFAFGGFAVAHNGNLTNALGAARAPGQPRLPVPVHHGQRGVHPPHRHQPLFHRGRPADRRAEAGAGRLQPGRAAQRRADRRARPARASARWCSAGSGGRMAGRPPGCWRARPARSTSSAPSSCATSTPARSSSSTTRACAASSPSASHRPASASSSTSTSPAPTASSRARRSTRRASASAPSWPAKAACRADVVVPVPDSGVPAAMGYAVGGRHPLRARHHPQPLCRPHLHRADRPDPPPRREAEAQRQPADAGGQARHPGGRQHRPRHHQPQDRGDGARGRCGGGAHAHLLPAHHA